MKSNTPLESTVESFISRVEKSKISVVIPLFGYWKDDPNYNPELEDALKITLNRLYSSVHNVYLIFVADNTKMSDNMVNILLGRQKAGNTQGIAMKKGDGYGKYLRAGINKALENKDCQYIICINPWVLIQHNALDMLADRINRDDAKIVSGYDMRGIIECANLDHHKYNTPLEERGIDTNFFGMKRMAAEIIDFDENYSTHYFIGRDAWQSIYTKGFESIITQRIPTFSFEVEWPQWESRGDFEKDKQYFTSKWKFGEGSIEYK